MIKILNIALVAAVLVVALQVYSLEHESRDATKRLAGLREDIVEEREAIRRLRAEWSYLNTPARLEKLAGRHLSHKPEDVSRVLSREQIADDVPALAKVQKDEPETETKDPISEMLSSASTAITGSAAEPAPQAEPDPIGQILKGLE